MADTDTVVASPEAPSIPVAEPQPTPAEEPTEAPSEQPADDAPIEEGEEQETQKAVWNPETFADDPAFKEHQDEFKRTAFREGHIAGQKREAGQRNQSIQARETIVQGIARVNQTLQQLHDSGQGLDGATFQRILQENAPALNDIPRVLAEDTIHVAQRATGAVTTAVTLAQVAQYVEDPKLLEIAGRLVEPTGKTDAEGNPVYKPSAEFEYDNGKEAVQDFMKALVKSVREDADKKGYERGVKMGRSGQIEATKAETRTGKGPAEVKGGSSSAKGITSMDDADRRYNLPTGDPQAITHDQYKEARERFGKK